MISASQSTDHFQNIRRLSYSNPQSFSEHRNEKQPYERKSVTTNKFLIPKPITYLKETFEGIPNLYSLENLNVQSTDIIDYTLETIVKARFASIDPKQLPEIKRYLSKMETLDNYNPINLLFMLRKTNNYLRDTVQDRKGIVIEIKYFLDEEDDNLDGISIDIYLRVKDAKKLSDVWGYLNENIGSEESGGERIFFNVREKM